MMAASSGDGEIDFSVGACSALHAPNVAIMWLVMGSGTEEGEEIADGGRLFIHAQLVCWPAP